VRIFPGASLRLCEGRPDFWFFKPLMDPLN
jgi:hypothetical protein